MLYNEDNPNLDGCPPGESIESPGKTFEEVFIEKNLSVTYLALDWTDDDTSIKFINLFPNCQSLYLHLWAKSDRQKKSQYVIEFPLLKNLFETSLCCNVSDDELDYIRVGNSLKACDFTWIKNKEACAIAWTKFIKRNINIRKLSLTNEIDHHSLLVITSKMRQLKHLDIKSLSFQSENFIDQPMVDIICDYAPIQDIEMKQVKETFGNQIVDKYYVNKERCPSDVFINLNTESKMMDIKIFHNAKYSVYAYDYAKYRHSDCKKLTLL